MAIKIGLCAIFLAPLLTLGSLSVSALKSQHDRTPQELADSAADGVRCYCNAAACVGAGYMCRARRGCFTELGGPDARRGCLHHLADSEEEAMSKCQNSPGGAAGGGGGAALLLCCFHHVCNHVDSPAARAGAHLNHTQTDYIGEGAEESAGPGYANSEVWFKAATIAVPVCGAVILFLLVAVAVRLLRADALYASSQKLGAPYMAHHSPHTNSLDTKKVLINCGASSPLLVHPQGCQMHMHQQLELMRKYSSPGHQASHMSLPYSDCSTTCTNTIQLVDVASDCGDIATEEDRLSVNCDRNEKISNNSGDQNVLKCVKVDKDKCDIVR